jgi:hypothetical protein
MMTSIQPAPQTTLTYPTLPLQSVIDDLRTDIAFMRRWYEAPPARDLTGNITEVTPAAILATLEKIVESAEPALRFFLNYPTQRLSVVLNYFVDESETFLSWLTTFDEASCDPSLNATMYQQSSERLRASLASWHNAVILAGIEYGLDTDTPEIQH